MSILYLFLIANVLGGIFNLGRMINLLCIDIIMLELGIITWCNLWRISRLKRIDRDEKL